MWFFQLILLNCALKIGSCRRLSGVKSEFSSLADGNTTRCTSDSLHLSSLKLTFCVAQAWAAHFTVPSSPWNGSCHWIGTGNQYQERKWKSTAATACALIKMIRNLIHGSVGFLANKLIACKKVRTDSKCISCLNSRFFLSTDIFLRMWENEATFRMCTEFM